jgi:hypothetical protein
VVKGREWFQDRSCSMPQDDDALIAELTSPTVVQSKADMKKRGMRSPDLAFLLTFACGSGAQAVSSSRVLRPAPGHGWQRRIWGRVTPRLCSAFSNCLLETSFCRNVHSGSLSRASTLAVSFFTCAATDFSSGSVMFVSNRSSLARARWGSAPKLTGRPQSLWQGSRTGEEDRAVSEQI